MNNTELSEVGKALVAQVKEQAAVLYNVLGSGCRCDYNTGNGSGTFTTPKGEIISFQNWEQAVRMLLAYQLHGVFVDMKQARLRIVPGAIEGTFRWEILPS